MQVDEAQRWLNWCSRLQGIAQNGLTFAQDAYDVERYTQLRTIVAEMLSAGTNVAPAEACAWLEKDSGYTTPKVDVRGVVFRDGRLLLVREKSDGKWSLPGGWADVNGSPAENIVREIFEESGFRTRVLRLLAVFDRSKHPHLPVFPFHVYKLFLHCEIIGGGAMPSAETAEIGFFGVDEIPELSETRITSWQVQRMFDHLRNPALPPDLDLPAE
jgi:ADP-ribose pyrophosphatase YjhB (NUDIX family)